MSHPITTKARAMADLLLGELPRDIATATRIPVPTLYRWRGEAWSLVRASLSDETRQQLAELRKMWPALRKNDSLAWAGPRCSAKTRAGGLCQSFPVRGAKRCRMHCGRCIRMQP